MVKKKLRCTRNEHENEDRFSSLPDELIHHILWFSDARLAVQTSVLSKRWKLIWTSLPFLNLPKYKYKYEQGSNNLITVPMFTSSRVEFKFIHNLFSFRNHQYEILKLNLSFTFELSRSLVDNSIHYAISHNVRNLNLDYRSRDLVLPTFSSTSLKKLQLKLYFKTLLESDCWNLPALNTLHVICIWPTHNIIYASYLTCLPSLRNLSLDGFELPESVSLPVLTTLYLARCRLPSNVGGFPALSTLTLDSVTFPTNASNFFLAFVNLRNLTLFIRDRITNYCCLNIPQVVNLEINDCTTAFHPCEIIVLSRKIVNFSSVGYLPMTFEVSELENVNIKLRDSTGCKPIEPTKKMKRYFRQVTRMFPALGSAKILTLDLETIKALSVVSDFLVRSPPPFHNLIYVKVPPGYEESSMSAYLKCYLLGGSPKATIVTTLPKDELIPQMLPVSLSTQKLLPKNILATPVAGAGDDRASSTKGGSDFDLWQGCEVKDEFIGLLYCIAKKYPETFDRFTTNSKELRTLKLNMLCATIKTFTNTSMTKIDAEMLAEYRALFSDLQRSFNVNWLVDRLNYVEQLQFSQPLLDKFHAVDSLIGDGNIGPAGTSLDSNIGDDIFAGP